MSPEVYSSLFLFLLSLYAAGAALRRRGETDSRSSYTWVFLAVMANASGMASNLALLSGLAPSYLQPFLDTIRFWAGAGFVYFLYSWTLTVDPWRRPTRRRATVAALVAVVSIAVIPSHGNQSVVIPADWRWANWVGIGLFYASLLYITSFFLNLRAQKAVTPGLSWVILFQKILLWIAMYMGAGFFVARISLAVASYLGLQALPAEPVALIQEVYKSTMGVFFFLGLVPPRWLVRLVRKLQHVDNARWQSQYAVQATADLAAGTNPVYRSALVTFVTALADYCRVPYLSRVDLLLAASLLGTSHPLATPNGELIAEGASSEAANDDTAQPRTRPPLVISLEAARLLQTSSGDGTAPATGDPKALILRASDVFVREAYRDGLSPISPDDAQRGWAAAQGIVKDKRVLDGLRQALVDAGLFRGKNPLR